LQDALGQEKLPLPDVCHRRLPLPLQWAGALALAAGALVAHLAWPTGHWLELGGIAGLPLALLIVVAVPEKPGRTDTS
jgi:hypothetical protein